MRAPIRFRHRVRGDGMDPRRRRPGPIRPILLALVVAILVAPTGQATTRLPSARLVSAGSAVTDWSTITANVVAAKNFPGIAPIFASIVQVAIYDAVIAMRAGTPRTPPPSTPRGTLPRTPQLPPPGTTRWSGCSPT
ncbi:MAG TPA: hypothetical protein VEQ37_03470 [Actinomycetota bacterium]|nr:hypothetical protein [Actinomycetota bacterium]